MINCYISNNSYYIVGDNIEVYSKYELDTENELHKIYMGCIYLLVQLRGYRDNVSIYSDSRFVDDLTGIIEPLDDFCKEGFRIIKGMTSSLYGVVLYKKIKTDQLNNILNVAQEMMMIDDKYKADLYIKQDLKFKSKHFNRVQKLKDFFFGDKNGS